MSTICRFCSAQHTTDQYLLLRVACLCLRERLEIVAPIVQPAPAYIISHSARTYYLRKRMVLAHYNHWLKKILIFFLEFVHDT